MTLAVAKPPYHSPTCRPPPSRDTPHTHWTLLQRDLPIEHQRTSSIPSPFSLVLIPQHQGRSRNDPPRVQDAFRSPHTTSSSSPLAAPNQAPTACTTPHAPPLAGAQQIRRFCSFFTQFAPEIPGNSGSVSASVSGRSRKSLSALRNSHCKRHSVSVCSPSLQNALPPRRWAQKSRTRRFFCLFLTQFAPGICQ